MHSIKQKMTYKHKRAVRLFVITAFVILLPVSLCLAVTSKITRHNSGSELLKGKADDVVVSSKGTITLGRRAETLVDKFEDANQPWSINCIVVSGPTVFFGTSPNGGIYKYSLDKLTRLYPQGDGEGTSSQLVGPSEPPARENDANSNEEKEEDEDSETVESDEHLTNEHIFAMALDVSGQLLAGISGKTCKLIRFRSDKIETVFEPDDAKYIFAITLDNKGNIILGTGPEGKVYMLDSFGRNPRVAYDCKDKNILSLSAGDDGFIYAGSDDRGLIYKINTTKKTATVLYDSDQPEVTSLLQAGGGDLFAVTTSAKLVQTQQRFASQQSAAGRPESESEEDNGSSAGGGGRKLQIPNSKTVSDGGKPAVSAVVVRGKTMAAPSGVYRITAKGFVRELFSENAVFFCLASLRDKLLVGTGNSAQLFSIDPDSEQQAIVHEDQQAAQITAMAVSGDEIYFGSANPAKLMKLAGVYAADGDYRSDLIDAGQPARWGKLQVDSDIPAGCSVYVSARSGNVKDINDPTFSDWTTPVEIKGPVQLDCPVGRFCQYKLLLKSPGGKETPVIREIAVASSVPNLAPKVESVSASRIETARKEGFFKIDFKAEDENDDTLIYRIDFRKIGRPRWIKIEDELEKTDFEWDSKTVEDGRYELRVTADDRRSNTSETARTASRISDPVVVDNTAPRIAESDIVTRGDTVTLRITLQDELSVIGKLEYTVDSNDDWIATIPDDTLYDTIKENFTIIIDDIEPGEHIVALKISDDVENTAYKTFDVTVSGN